MPELPEVEVVRRGLAEHVVGCTITDVAVLHPRAVRRHLAGPEDFATTLLGVDVSGAYRRGKYLWLTTQDSRAIVAHLGMSGQLLICAPQASMEKHLRIRFDLAGSRYTSRSSEPRQLRFVDQRTFGVVFVDELTSHALPQTLLHIAPDPFEPTFSAEQFFDRLRSRRTELKRALLDQTVISGVGNIYADEALWRARLHYRRPASSVTDAQAAILLTAIREVMGAALAAGGTSFDALYVNVNGQSGYFDRSLNAYGRENKPCHRCGTPIVREPFMNRSSYFCPSCQGE